MRPHTDLILLVEEHRQSLLAEAARARQTGTIERPRRTGPRARLASVLVTLALWIDRREAVAGLDPVLAGARQLPRHA